MFQESQMGAKGYYIWHEYTMSITDCLVGEILPEIKENSDLIMKTCKMGAKFLAILDVQ